VIKLKRRRKREAAAEGTKQEPKEAKEEAAAAPIRKGVYFAALIYVEGEQAPADNFDAPAEAAVRKALNGAFEGNYEGLELSLKRLEIENSVESDDEEPGDKKEKFSF
jgi:hypothetical protein